MAGKFVGAVLVAAGLLPLVVALGWLIYSQFQRNLRVSEDTLISHAQVLAGDSDRSLARLATSQSHRYALVDLANEVRPMTTF